jgi:hypothetical protein
VKAANKKLPILEFHGKINEIQKHFSFIFLRCLIILLSLFSILDYELLDLEIPTITIVGRLIKAGIPVLVYR